MVSEDRQRVIETNRSLRLIKNELESLLEKGVIDDEAFDTISGLLPAESSFNNSRSTPAPRNTSLPTPASTPAASSAAPAPAPPTAAMSALSVGGNPNPPPSYAQSTGPSAGPPALPGRNPPPAAAAPTKPIIAHARALYKYNAADARDCSFDKDDRIAIYEYMNKDWWMGRNQRSGQEGIFPSTYVVVEDAKAAQPAVLYPHQPAQPVYGQPAPGAYGGGYPGAPPPGQPYQHQPPPGQAAPAAEGGEGGSKMGEHGKKFGKKLGNAAIFGAGATIGSNIVNSIF